MTDQTAAVHPAVEFIRAIFSPEDRICIAAKKTDSRVFNADFKTVAEVCDDAYLDKLAAANDAGANVYVCMNSILPDHTRRRKEDIGDIRSVYLDLDTNGKEKLDAILASKEVPDPSMVLESSPGKYQVVWAVRGISKEQQEAALKRLIERFGGDPAASDCSRVLRLPGFSNAKYEDAPLVNIIHRNGVHGPYRASDFKVEGHVAEPVVDHSDAPRKTATDEQLDLIAAAFIKREFPNGIEAGQGHDIGLTRLAGKLRSEGATPSQVEHILVRDCLSFCLNAGQDWREMAVKCSHSISKKEVGADLRCTVDGTVNSSAPVETNASRFLKTYKFMGFEHTLSPEDLEAELDKEYPVIPLVKKVAPEWSDDIFYGLAGEIIKKASEYNEAHPAGMLLDLLVALGNIFGRNPYFIINKSKHFTNEFMARIGDSAYSRKGGGRDEIDALLKDVDRTWFTQRTLSGFGSAEAIIGRIQDATEQLRFNPRTNTHITTHVPGVDDKRLCIREGELASVFVLAGKQDSRADIVMRDGWDGKPLKNVVKGKTKDGLSNSLTCQEPHISISGDTTVDELLRKMPDGSDENGFGNRFMYCYVYRVKLCPHGGPEINWAEETTHGQKSYLSRLYDVVEFAKKQRLVPLARSAQNTWTRLYLQLENNHLPGLAGKMTSRAAPHIRRLAMIYALLDLESAVDTKHLRAAKRLWDYCEDSAQFCFNNMTKEQLKLFRWIETKQQPVTLSVIREEFYHRNERAEFIKSTVDSLVARGYLEQVGETYRLK